MPVISIRVRGPESNMSKGRDTKQREDKKKPAKSLKEKRADKAAKKAGTRSDTGINKALEKKPTSR